MDSRITRFPETAAQVHDLVADVRLALNDALLGCVLHGSLAMSGFDPARSDLDVLVILRRALTRTERAELGRRLLVCSSQPHPIELSAVLESDLLAWQHPCPHQFHFGESHRDAFIRGEIDVRHPVDPDLAMHLTVARHRGIDLLGSWPVDRLPKVPLEHFIDAIRQDFRWAAAQPRDLSDYQNANACRTLAFLEAGAVLSKSEGIDWCRERGISPAKALKIMTIRLELSEGEAPPST